MASKTPRFGLNRFGNGVDGSLGDDGGKFTGTDRMVLDRVLAAYETHVHAGGERLGDPSGAPTLVLDSAGGSLPGGKTYYYTVTYIDEFGLETAYADEASVTTPAQVSIPTNPGLNTINAGTLAEGLYQYALTAHKGSGETPLSGISTVTVSDWKQVDVSFVAPANADAISIWRQGPAEAGFTRVATVAVGDSPYSDDGSVPADPCACDPGNLPPSQNTTGSDSRVTITAPTGDLVQPTLAKRWRIYRTESSGAYSSRSLLFEVSETTTEGGTQLVESWIDDGTVQLTAGQPPTTSRTLLPSQAVQGGGGGSRGTTLLRSPDDSLWQLYCLADGSLVTRERDFGAVNASLFADLGFGLDDSSGVEWRLTVDNAGVLTTTQVAADPGEAAFLYGQGPDLPTSDPLTQFRLGVEPDGALITYG